LLAIAQELHKIVLNSSWGRFEKWALETLGLDEEKVGDFIVGTMIFGIVLTIGKNMVSGLEAHWF
jgi:hypothetical protein